MTATYVSEFPAISLLEAHIRMAELAQDLAERYCNTRLVPAHYYKRPADGAVAILCGLELDLDPLIALQRVIPVRGATLAALTMVAMLQDKGYTIKTISQSATAAEVHGWKPGRDPDTDAPDATHTYTIERAIAARYVPQPSSPESQRRPEVETDWVTVLRTGEDWSRRYVVGNMLYITDPESMLVAKSRTKVCQELAPEVLLGIATSTEDQRDFRVDDDEATPPEPVSGPDEPIVLGGTSTAGHAASRLADKIKPPVPPPGESAEANPVTEAVPPSGAGDTEPVEEQVAPEGTTTTGPGQGNDDSEPKPAQEQPAAQRKTSTKDKPPMTAMRRSLESRLFKLLGQVDVTDRDDRLDLYRAILQRPEVGSTDDLNDVELTTISDQLYKWHKAGEAEDQIREIVNAATQAAESKEAS